MSEVFGNIQMYRRELGNAEKSFLLYITLGHNTVYKIMSYMKSIGKGMAYKNVHSRVKILKELKRIEKDTEIQKPLRNAIPYKLTTSGLFYIIYKITNYPVSLLTKYRNNIVLQTLLYRYFQDITIKRYGGRLQITLIQYLREACDITLYGFVNAGVSEKALRQLPSESTQTVRKWLEENLEWHAKSLAFRLASLDVEKYIRVNPNQVAKRSIIISPTVKEPELGLMLVKDKKFMEFLRTTVGKFTSQYSKFLEIEKSNSKE